MRRSISTKIFARGKSRAASRWAAWSWGGGDFSELFFGKRWDLAAGSIKEKSRTPPLHLFSYSMPILTFPIHRSRIPRGSIAADNSAIRTMFFYLIVPLYVRGVE